jgi:hypothetical protein
MKKKMRAILDNFTGKGSCNDSESEYRLSEESKEDRESSNKERRIEGSKETEASKESWVMV